MTARNYLRLFVSRLIASAIKPMNGFLHEMTWQFAARPWLAASLLTSSSLEETLSELFLWETKIVVTFTLNPKRSKSFSVRFVGETILMVSLGRESLLETISLPGECTPSQSSSNLVRSSSWIDSHPPDWRFSRCAKSNKSIDFKIFPNLICAFFDCVHFQIWASKSWVSSSLPKRNFSNSKGNLHKVCSS